MLRLPRNPSRNRPAEAPIEPRSHKPLTLSMLISEWVYWLVVVVERLLRLLDRFLVRPARLQYRCLFW